MVDLESKYFTDATGTTSFRAVYNDENGENGELVVADSHLAALSKWVDSNGLPEGELDVLIERAEAPHVNDVWFRISKKQGRYWESKEGEHVVLLCQPLAEVSP